MDETTHITALAVNDNPDHLYLLRKMLESAGCSVLTASDGRQAFDLLLRERVDIILSDVMMPGVDGIQLCRMVRAHPELESLPILLVSALRKDTTSVVEGLSAGADDYLEHPFAPSALVARIARLVERKRSEDQVRRLNEELELRVRERTAQLEGANAKLEREILERKFVEAALEKARDAALEAARLKSEFLANVSHEIRTPMHAVTGMAELLLKTPLKARQREYVESIIDGARSLLDVINDVLDLSKIEAGELRVEKADFGPEELVSASVQMFAERATAKGLKLTSSVQAHVPRVLQGDPGRLRQVMVNLLSNAVKFTKAGRVALDVSLEGEDESHVTLRFEVSDTGIGVRPSQTRLIFLPFAQADGSDNRAYGGTGLGLAISRQLVELMGGEIGVESEVGRGSVFWFTVQLAKPAPASAAARTAQVRLDGLGALVVAQDPVSRDALLRQARGWNMHAAAVAPADALGALREAAQAGSPYTFALIELHGAEQGAFELARRIRGDGEMVSATRLVLITTRVLVHEEESDCERVFDAWLVSPMKRQQLYDCLQALAGGDSSRKGRPPARAAAGPSKATRPAVLVAEDNRVNQQVVVYMLEELGYQAVVVGDGEHAVTTYARGHFQLVLMDCQMPVMDGYAATAAIRHLDGDDRHTPIVALTADAMTGARERCLAVGMDDYLSKPFTIEQLGTVLSKWLNGDAARRVAAIANLREVEAGDAAVTLDPGLLSRLGGQAGAQAKRAVGLVETFLSDTRARRRSLGEACDLGDFERVRREAHALKGGVGLFGALRLAHICNDMVDHAARADRPALQRLLRELDAELAQVTAKLEQWKVNA